jgi:hypothetical protein
MPGSAGEDPFIDEDSQRPTASAAAAAAAVVVVEDSYRREEEDADDTSVAAAAGSREREITAVRTSARQVSKPAASCSLTYGRM